MTRSLKIIIFMFSMSFIIAFLNQFAIFGASGELLLGKNVSWSDTIGNYTYVYDPVNNTFKMSGADNASQLVSEFQNYSPSGLDTIDILGIIFLVFRAALDATLLLPWFLMNLGFDPVMAAVITGPVWLMYMLFIFQIVSNRLLGSAV